MITDVLQAFFFGTYAVGPCSLALCPTQQFRLHHKMDVTTGFCNATEANDNIVLLFFPKKETSFFRISSANLVVSL